MDYNTFKTKVSNNQHLPNYYTLLWEHRQAIQDDIDNSKQYIVAAQLHLQPIKLSHIMQVLNAIPNNKVPNND